MMRTVRDPVQDSLDHGVPTSYEDDLDQIHSHYSQDEGSMPSRPSRLTTTDRAANDSPAPTDPSRPAGTPQARKWADPAEASRTMETRQSAGFDLPKPKSTVKIREVKRTREKVEQDTPANHQELKKFINRYSSKLSLQSAMKDTQLNFDFMHFKNCVM